LFYQLPATCSDRKWADYKYYEVNKKEVYIYTKNGKIGEVIVEELIGINYFSSVMDIVRQKLQPKYQGNLKFQI